MKYYGPFQVIEKIGTVAYRLQLPPVSLIHPVFHVSQLMAQIGDNHLASPELPVVNPQAMVKDVPEKILDQGLYKKGTAAGVKLLIKWKNRPEEDATWEDYEAIEKDHPQFILGDKDSFKERGMSATTGAGLGAAVDTSEE